MGSATADPEHGAATVERTPHGWRVECHDCPWASAGHGSDTAAEKAWYGHAGSVPVPSRAQAARVLA